ncbi:MAG: cupin domain-containing protein [Pseudomonadota bacterium]
MEVIDIQQALSQHPSGSFLKLLDFNENHFGMCDITGTSPVWEMHPDTDEFFFIVDGRFEITLLDADEPSLHVAEAGSSFVVPRGIWHLPAAPDGCKFIHFTPGESLHSDAEDPRAA